MSTRRAVRRAEIFTARATVLLLAIILCAGGAQAQSIYKWSAPSGSWTTPTNWSPPRWSPSPSDYLVFDGAMTPAPQVSNVSNDYAAQILMMNGVNVRLYGDGSAPVLNISGKDGTDLDIPAGCGLAMSGPGGITIHLGFGATGRIAGSVIFESGGPALTAVNPGGIEFVSGSTCTTQPGYGGRPFGATYPNSVKFRSGSTYWHLSGADPFGMPPPGAVVVFEPGSMARFSTRDGFSADGRTYADLTLDAGTVFTADVEMDFRFQNLLVASGLILQGSGGGRVYPSGNLSSVGGATIDFRCDVEFSGGTQLVGGGGGGAIKFNRSVTVRPGDTLAVVGHQVDFNDGTYVQGAFRLDDGGMVMAPASFVYASGATLIFNRSMPSGYTVNPGDQLWPDVNGPTNVTVQGTGDVNVFTARTVPGVLKVAGRLGPSGLLTATGTLEVWDDASFMGAPVYGADATLVYRTSRDYFAQEEWRQGSSPGPGVPRHVTLQLSGGQVRVDRASVPGTLSILAGTFGPMQVVDVLESVYIGPGGTLLFDSGMGSVQFSGATFTNDGTCASTWPSRDGGLIFTGTQPQTLAGRGSTGTSAAPISRLVVDKPGSWLSIETENPVYTGWVSLVRGELRNSPRLYVGTPESTANTWIEYGARQPMPDVAGTFDAPPTFVPGQNGISVSYAYEVGPHTMGIEIPPNRSLGYVELRNPNGVIMTGGDLDVRGLMLGQSRLTMPAGSTVNVAAGGGFWGGGVLPGGSAVGGTVRLLGSCYVEGYPTVDNLTIAGEDVDFRWCYPTVRGTLLLDGGRPINGSGVTYADGSTLRYGRSYTLGDEWRSGSSGTGVPWHVEIAGGTLDFNPNASNTPRSVRGDLTIPVGASLLLGNNPGGDLYLAGRFVNHGSLVHRGRNVTFNGTTPQTLPGGETTFGDLTVANPAGLALDGNITIGGTLRLHGGCIAAADHLARVLEGGQVERITGHVVGALEKRVVIAGGAGDQTFEIGDATRYTPVDFHTGTGAAPFTLTARTTTGGHPQIAGSGLNPAKSVNRWYSLTSPDAAGKFSTCDATLHFDPSDVAPGADPARFLIAKFDGANWSLPAVGARTSTSIRAAGMSSLSEFIVAEALTQVSPSPPATCISTAHPCVQVPVALSRTGSEPMRAFSVTVSLTPNLTLCGAGIEEGGYLNGAGDTHFEVLDNGDGSHTVDCAILGLPCGATASSGTLFTLNLGSGVPGGTGTVTVTSVTLRDCDNGPIVANPGSPISIDIDNQAPAGITTLAASQQKTGNGTDGTTRINLTWPAVEAGAGVELWRKGYGNYPEYDDPPGAGSPPTLPASHPPAGWTLAATMSGGATSHADAPAARDFWSYVAYVVDPCGNVSAVSNLTGGTLSYHLGDTHTGVDNCAGDNAVNTADVSYLGSHYGATLMPSSALGCLDVGPTTDYSVNARPTTDNRVNFEDLILLAINYGVVSAPQLAARPVARPATAATSAVRLTVPELPAVGEQFAVGVTLESAGSIKGLSLDLSFNAAVVEPVGVEPGGLLISQGPPALALSARPGNLDVALLGTDETIAGAGEVARMVFRVKATGAAAITLDRIEARDAANRPVTLGLAAAVPGAEKPASTVLMSARPNPFAGVTTLSYALAAGGPVELAIYSVDGRRVTTLVRETKSAGTYHPTWDGRDDLGVAVRPGMYYARLSTQAGRLTRTLVLMK